MSATTRPNAARLIAGAIALGGLYEAVLIAGLTVTSGWAGMLLALILFAPGWFAFFALIWTTFGKRLPGDPVTTWISCFIVNGFWALLLIPDMDWNAASKAFTYYYVRA